MKLRLTSDAMRLVIPALSMTVLLAAVFWLQPRAMSYFGLNLLLNLAVPIALATIAQMLVMAVNDLDLSIGAFVSFVACVTATFLRDAPLVGTLILAGAVGVYALIGGGDPPAQPALDRRDARHELRLGRACGADAAGAGRAGARLGALADDRQARRSCRWPSSPASSSPSSAHMIVHAGPRSAS